MPSPSSWKQFVATLIPKVHSPVRIAEYRPITLPPALYKLYMRFLLQQLNPHLEAMGPWCFGFRPGHQASELIQCVRTLVEKAKEWDEALCVAKLDLSKAYDRTYLHALFASLEKQGIPKWLCMALVRETKGVHWHGRLGMCSSAPVALTRGVRQGDPAAPALFCLVMNQVLTELQAVAEANGIGIVVDGVRVVFLSFADDIYVLAQNPERLAFILEHLADAFQQVGLKLNADKSVWCCTKSPLEQLELPLAGLLIPALEREKPMIVLGSAVSFLNLPKCSHAH
eukprot:15467023-Alexandrium_andersonii.AAC.1